MSFLTPVALFAAMGIALPIVAHLLSRYRVKRTDWAAMQFLNRSVRVRSRQIRLRDLLLLLVRCLVVLFLVLALGRPFLGGGSEFALGERRAGVVFAVDASYSMGHDDGRGSRFERALNHVRAVAKDLQPGDPVSFVLLGADHRVVARNRAFDPDAFERLLSSSELTSGTLELESVPSTLHSLADAMDAHQKEIYIATDMADRDWAERPEWLRGAFGDLAQAGATTVIPVRSGSSNLAITELELVSGVLRRDTVARYRATVHNFGTEPAVDVSVQGLADGVVADRKSIPSIAPGVAETVSLFVRFRDVGPVRISAKLADDQLPVDDVRRTVAIVRENVSVLSVEGPANGATGFVAAALEARGDADERGDFSVQSVSWVDLPAQDLASFDVVILHGVPEITAGQSATLDAFVRSGKGLIWFPGDRVDAAAWNRLSASSRIPLLPAELGAVARTSDQLGVGRPLDSVLSDHPACRPLRSLPEDLLSETRFLKVMELEPRAASRRVLSLAGTGAPVLLEHAIGRGHVCMFTASADADWSNMAVTPMFPMALQQLVTYLTSREFEAPREVGDPLSLRYVDRPDASEAVFETPAGVSLTVEVREHRSQFVALLERAREAGFYEARVRLQAPGIPIAVNVDTAESDVRCMPTADVDRWFADMNVTLARSDGDVQNAVASARNGRSFSRLLLLGAVALLMFEGLLIRGRRTRRESSAVGGAA